MLISYVLPVYNCQATIARCLDSLLNQKEKVEIIVINDGSTDNTERILNYYRPKLDLVFTHPVRHGAAYCRNFGNAHAKGKIIAVCDCDHYYKSRSSAIKEFFTKNKDKSVFYSALHLRYQNQMDKYLMEAYKWDFKSKCPISHPTVAYRKEVIKKVSYKQVSTETDLYEFFLLDAYKECFEFGGCQDPLMLKIDGNSTRDVKSAKALKKAMYREYDIEI